MGKTFRRGGSERGSYYPGKSIRDKRQNNGGTHRVPKGDNALSYFIAGVSLTPTEP